MNSLYQIVNEKYTEIKFNNQDYSNEIENYINLITNISSNALKQKMSPSNESKILKLEIILAQLDCEIFIDVRNMNKDLLIIDVKKLIYKYVTKKSHFLELNLNAISINVLKNKIILKKITENSVKCNITCLFGIFKNYRIINKLKKRRLTYE